MSVSASQPLSSTLPIGFPDWQAQAVPVRIPGGVLLTGWAIKKDLVLVYAAGLDGIATVTIDGQDIKPITSHETTRGIDLWQPLTALELPEGTLNIAGERFPPELPPKEEDGGHGVRRSFWCMVFPRIRGC